MIIQGNVGIGTTSPAYKLDVDGTGRFSSDLYSLFFKVTDGYGMHKPTSNTLSLVAGGVVGLTFDGASGATATFSSSVTTGGDILVPYNSSDQFIGARFSGTYYNGLVLNGTSRATGIVSRSGDATDYIWFGTNSATERMRITNAGNVGIGTTSPYSKLDVSGAISMNGAYFAANNATYTQIYKAQSNSVGLYIGGAGDPQNYYDNTQHFFRSSGGVATYAIINSSGDMGIGTSSPSYKLSIQGSAGIEQSEEYFYFNSSYSVGNNARGKIRAVGAGGGSGYGGDLRFSSRASNNVWNEDVMTISNNGNVGIGATSPNALLDVNGDALINGLTVGRGSGNSAYNTAFGVGALSSNTSGEYNLAIGRSANSAVNISGATVIGTDLFTSPGNSSLTSNCLAISQHNPSNSGTQYPHIYAPDKVNCPNGDTTTDVLAVDYSVYTAVFMEYSIFNSAGDQFRAGTYTVAFKGTGTPVDDDNQTVVYSGTTLAATFTIGGSGSVAIIQLRNQDSDTYDIRVTARLLMR
jgi:hypothetical protein